MDWKKWSNGLLAGFVSGAADGLLLNMAAPETFNLAGGWKATLSLSVFFGVKAAAMYLKTQPPPGTTRTELRLGNRNKA